MGRCTLIALLAVTAYAFSGFEQHLQDLLCQVHNDASAYHTEEETVQKVCSLAHLPYEDCREKGHALWETAEFMCSSAVDVDPRNAIERLVCRLFNGTVRRHRLEVRVCDIALHKLHLNISDEKCATLFDLAWGRAQQHCPQEQPVRDELGKILPDIENMTCAVFRRAKLTNVTAEEAAEEICNRVVKQHPRVCPVACKAAVIRMWPRLEKKCAAPPPALKVTPAGIEKAICRALNNSQGQAVVINSVCNKVAAKGPVKKVVCVRALSFVWNHAEKRCPADVGPTASSVATEPREFCSALTNARAEDSVILFTCLNLRVKPVQNCRVELKRWWEEEKKANCPAPDHFPPVDKWIEKLFCRELSNVSRADAVSIACNMIRKKDPKLPEDACEESAGAIYDRSTMRCAGQKPTPIIPALEKLACSHLEDASVEVHVAQKLCASVRKRVSRLPEGLCEAVVEVTWAKAEEKCMGGPPIVV